MILNILILALFGFLTSLFLHQLCSQKEYKWNKSLFVSSLIVTFALGGNLLLMIDKQSTQSYIEKNPHYEVISEELNIPKDKLIVAKEGFSNLETTVYKVVTEETAYMFKIKNNRVELYYENKNS